MIVAATLMFVPQVCVVCASASVTYVFVSAGAAPVTATMTQYMPGVLVKSGQPPARSKAKLVLFILLLPVLLLLIAVPVYLLSESVYPSSIMAESKSQSLNLSTSLNGFTLDLYKVLSETSPGENLFFSPLSVMTALGMTLVGSKSNSRVQLAEALKLHPHSDDTVQNAFAEIVAKYKQEDLAKLYELHMANLMYVSENFSMQDQFADALTKHFQAAAKVVDFGGQSEQVRQEINAAVEDATNKKITDLIPGGVLNSMTVLVLVNAVYFKGLWNTPFEKSNTVDAPFYTDEDTSVMVPMMKANEKYRYMIRKDLEATVLGMDYKGGNLSFVIVLPDKRTGLADVESKLQGTDLRELFNTGHQVKVDVTIPRFKLEYSQNLVEPLKQLGVTDLFGAEADLSGIGGGPGEIFVSHVLHKAFIDVNEEGSEAAAATAVVAMARMMVRPLPPFVADHPFLFLLQDRQTGLVLFAGRYSLPNSSPAKQEL
ncbi:Serpin domain [Trinorchestia longiramus]|nr:Serpin domain [Trinorchestia longiramus]